jgi:putative molybdopterin biosynthesis protein
VITSLVQADGITIIPRGIQGLPAQAEVKVRLYRTSAEIDRTLFVIGSHDVTIDLLAQHLAGMDRRLVSANVGSLAGLMALKRGEAHFCGSHLLDPDSGIYNLTYIKQYLSGQSIVVVGFVERQQGLLVKVGNPKKLFRIEDLIKPDVTFINRQHGAGTRVLLDHQLSTSGITPDSIRGYDQEEYTHLAVAAAVKSGRADCGLGIAAAADALGLDFIPLYLEEYQLIIPRDYYYSGLLSPLRDILDDNRFHGEVEKLPGYNTSKMGQIIAELG